MNGTIRRILTATDVSRRIYCAAREAYHTRRVDRGARRYFVNAHQFKEALHAQSLTSSVDLRTVDGLTITIRQNYGDAMTVAEIFLDDCYIHDLSVPPDPVVIDVGGFIGDFALYAVKRLNASKVIVCEPSPRNWELLLKNIENNGYEGRILPVNKAVTDGSDLMMNIDAPDEAQCMVSGYFHTDQPLRSISGISLSQIMREYDLETVDLLKIDCEGGEYAILDSTPSDIYSRIRNIVFEYHDVEDGWAKLEKAKQRLQHEGYSLRSGRGLISASRTERSAP
jgi:FkbM family methyltransferase